MMSSAGRSGDNRTIGRAHLEGRDESRDKRGEREQGERTHIAVGSNWQQNGYEDDGAGRGEGEEEEEE